MSESMEPATRGGALTETDPESQFADLDVDAPIVGIIMGSKSDMAEMEKAGGNNNAYTSQDVTVYTDWFPSSALELMFDMESDRIQNLAFDPRIIESDGDSATAWAAPARSTIMPQRISG